jgi:hypothetical protein
MILDTIKAKRNESQEIKQDVKQEETVYQCLHRHAISLEYTTYSSNLYKSLYSDFCKTPKQREVAPFLCKNLPGGESELPVPQLLNLFHRLEGALHQ